MWQSKTVNLVNKQAKLHFKNEQSGIEEIGKKRKVKGAIYIIIDFFM